MKHTHVVIKPFSAEEKGGAMVVAGSGFTPRDQARARELERLQLIRPAAEKVIAAPQNKGTLSLRRK